MTRFHTTKEFLIVTALTVAVAVGFLPWLTCAKGKVEISSTLNNLKQIGMASNLYREDNLAYPLSLRPLVSIGYIPSKVCASALDNTKEGWANVFIKEQEAKSAMEPILPFRTSYVSLRTFGFHPGRINAIVESDAAGWLVDPTVGSSIQRPGWNWKGDYLRLCLTGNVVRRSQPWTKSTYRGLPADSINFEHLFQDK